MDKVPHVKCLRCGGAMIYDKFYGHHEQFWGWRCLICGDIIDQIIMKNRQMMKADRELITELERKEKVCCRLAQNV